MRSYGILLFLAAFAACSSEPAAPPANAPASSSSSAQKIPIGQLPAIDADAVLAHTKTLASDEYEGRAPGTKGEELSVAYIADQFKKAGLKPGNTDGTYTQKVPLVGITADPAPLVFQKGAEKKTLKWKD